MNRHDFRAAMHEFRSALRSCYAYACYPAAMDLRRLERARAAVPYVCREDRERQHLATTAYPTTMPRHVRRGRPRTAFERYAQDRIDLVRLLTLRRNGHLTPEGKYISPRLVTRDIDRLLRRAVA